MTLSFNDGHKIFLVLKILYVYFNIMNTYTPKITSSKDALNQLTKMLGDRETPSAPDPNNPFLSHTKIHAHYLETDPNTPLGKMIQEERVNIHFRNALGIAESLAAHPDTPPYIKDSECHSNDPVKVAAYEALKHFEVALGLSDQGHCELMYEKMAPYMEQLITLSENQDYTAPEL